MWSSGRRAGAAPPAVGIGTSSITGACGGSSCLSAGTSGSGSADSGGGRMSPSASSSSPLKMSRTRRPSAIIEESHNSTE